MPHAHDVSLPEEDMHSPYPSPVSYSWRRSYFELEKLIRTSSRVTRDTLSVRGLMRRVVRCVGSSWDAMKLFAFEMSGVRGMRGGRGVKMMAGGGGEMSLRTGERLASVWQS